MPKIKVRTKFDLLDAIKERKAFPKNFGERLGQMIIQEMIRSITRGQSPVQGFGRFKAYRAQRKPIKTNARGENIGYPKGIPGKQVRPVDLVLTGEMLSFLDFGLHPTRQGSMSVGYSNDAPADVRLRAEVHNKGTHPDIPQRKFIPNEPGDQFIQIITRRILKFYREQWAKTIDKTNK